MANGDETSNNPFTTGQICIKSPPFECRFYLNETTLTSLHLKITELGNENRFSQDDLHCIEQYFDRFVASTYNPSALESFQRLLNLSHRAHTGMLKSVLCLMKHQLNLNPEPSVAWHASLCLTLPPPNAMTPPIHALSPTNPVLPGNPAIIGTPQGNKILFWLKLTSVLNPENQVIILPLRYDGELNEMQVFGTAPNYLMQQQLNASQIAMINDVNMILKRQITACQAVHECCLWPTVRDFCQNLQPPQ